MLIRSNRTRAALWAAALAAIVCVAIASPANAQTRIVYGGLTDAYGNCVVADSPAHMIYAYQPGWAEVAAAQGSSQPTTIVLVRLDGNGNVIDDSVWRSSGNSVFDNEALRAVRLSSFAPEQRSCVGYAGSYLVDVSGAQTHLAYTGLGPPPLYTFEPIIVRAQCPLSDQPARVTYQYQPEWPEVALAQGVAPATSTVAVTIDAQGNLVDESIWRSSGNDLLDNEALKAVRLSSYAPEMHQCVRFAGSYLMDVAFTD